MLGMNLLKLLSSISMLCGLAFVSVLLLGHCSRFWVSTLSGSQLLFSTRAGDQSVLAWGRGRGECPSTPSVGFLLSQDEITSL